MFNLDRKTAVKSRLNQFWQTILLFLLIQSSYCYGQVYLTGPPCVVPVTEYQYNISANWGDESQIQVCINGGVVSGTNDVCYVGIPINQIKIKWSEATTGSISIQSLSQEIASLTVSITHELFGGTIDTASAVQVIQPSALPAPINCSVATGGGCGANYFYQWQKSFDHKAWTNIDGANGLKLVFTTPVNSAAYYRRKTIEWGSDNESYSDVATILLTPFN